MQGDSGTDAFRCVEMREGTPWLYQADCYGVCGVVHCLLFGDYMEVDRVRDAAGGTCMKAAAPHIPRVQKLPQHGVPHCLQQQLYSSIWGCDCLYEKPPRI